MTNPVTLSESHLRLLDVVAKNEQRTVENLVRQAVDTYLARKDLAPKEIDDAAFGAWGPGEDGLAYQERLRREW